MLRGLVIVALALFASTAHAEPLAAPVVEVSELSEEVRLAQEDVSRWPSDYSAWVRLARAAEADHPELAVEAWREAEAINPNGRNLETAAGQVVPQLAVGNRGAARRAASDAVNFAPQLPGLHLLRATARAEVGAWVPEWFGDLRAQPSLRAAIRVAPAAGTRGARTPSDDAAWCAMGWGRLRLADSIGARRAFARVSDEATTCGGNAFAQPENTMSAYFSTTGIAYQNADNTGGLSFSAGADALVGRVLILGLSGRALWVGQSQTQTVPLPPGETGAPGSPPASGGVSSQQEVWGRIGLTHRGHGVQAVVGGAFSQVRGQAATNKFMVGGTAWASWFVTPRIEAAFSRYADGSALQGALGVRVPLVRHLSLDGGAQMTRFASVEDVDLPEGVPSAEVSDQPMFSGFGSLRLEAPKFQLSAGGRLGPEFRPIRLQDPTLWNLTRTITASGFVRGAVAPALFLSHEPVSNPIWLYAGYEVMRLAPSDTEGTSHLHLATIGISGTIVGVSR